MAKRRLSTAAGAVRSLAGGDRIPSNAQLEWLRRGLTQPGGKLPLFDPAGRRVSPATVTSCLKAGWAEPWFHNPLKPDWKVCRLTDAGRAVVARATVVQVDFSQRRSPVRRRTEEPAPAIDLAPRRL